MGAVCSFFLRIPTNYLYPLSTKVISVQRKVYFGGFVILAYFYRWQKKTETSDFFLQLSRTLLLGEVCPFFVDQQIPLSPVATKSFLCEGKFILEAFVRLAEIYSWQKKAETDDFFLQLWPTLLLGAVCSFFRKPTNYIYQVATKVISAQR